MQCKSICNKLYDQSMNIMYVPCNHNNMKNIIRTPYSQIFNVTLLGEILARLRASRLG